AKPPVSGMLNPIRTGSAAPAADVATAPSAARIITAATRQAARIEEQGRLHMRSPRALPSDAHSLLFRALIVKENAVARSDRGGTPGRYRMVVCHRLLVKCMMVKRSDAQSVVYVIDDDLAVREALGGLFRSVGLQVKTFATPPEFLASKLA